MTKKFPRLRPSLLQHVILLLMGAVYATMTDHEILLLMKAQMEKSNTVITNECSWEETDPKKSEFYPVATQSGHERYVAVSQGGLWESHKGVCGPWTLLRTLHADKFELPSLFRNKKTGENDYAWFIVGTNKTEMKLEIIAYMTLDDLKTGNSTGYTRYSIYMPMQIRSYTLKDDKYKKSWDSEAVGALTGAVYGFRIQEIIEGVAYLSFRYRSNATSEADKKRYVFGKATVFLPTIANFTDKKWDNYSMNFDGESAAPLYSFLYKTYPGLMDKEDFTAIDSKIPFAGKIWRFTDLGQSHINYSRLSYSLDNGPDPNGDFQFVNLELKWPGVVNDPIRYHTSGEKEDLWRIRELYYHNGRIVMCGSLKVSGETLRWVIKEFQWEKFIQTKCDHEYLEIRTFPVIQDMHDYDGPFLREYDM